MQIAERSCWYFILLSVSSDVKRTHVTPLREFPWGFGKPNQLSSSEAGAMLTGLLLAFGISAGNCVSFA